MGLDDAVNLMELLDPAGVYDHYPYCNAGGDGCGTGVQMLEGDFEFCDGDFLDLGYPRITQLHNDRVICAYYWSTASRIETHIAATIRKD
jgi:hypothetical protein